MCNTAAVISPRASHPETSPTFEDRLIRAYNDAAMVLMISLGHRAGLLNALAGAPPLTSNAIAERAGLNERYVREWLGAMVAAHVVETDPGNGTYQLPAEHAALLTNSGNANLAVFAQYIPLLGTVEDDVVRCFREGGGVPYERYGRFHEV
ncbi:MAG: transcriptional regulator, partial [Acidithiobacillales bacterium SM23_46]